MKVFHTSSLWILTIINIISLIVITKAFPIIKSIKLKKNLKMIPSWDQLQEQVSNTETGSSSSSKDY